MSGDSLIKGLPSPWGRLPEHLAIAVAASLPWSTSAASVFMVLWLLVSVPIISLARLHRELFTLAGGLPVLLVLIAALGMLWADVGWAERFDGLRDFQKLLFVPVVIAFFRYSDAGARVALSFLASCIALLALALATTFFPQLQWWQSWGPGVPVKNYITQSAEFAIAAFWLIYLALDAWKAGSRKFSIGCGCIAFLFFGHLIFVVTSRTELLILAILSLVTAAKWFGRKGLVSGLIALPIVALVAWSTSSYLRDRIQTTIADIQTYPLHGDETSTGFRMVFWKKSTDFMWAAPVIGHGTGSIESLFRQAAVGESGLSAAVTANPHNQILAVGIQLGLIGVVVLCAMWLVHIYAFLGRGLFAWFGLVVVIQTILGSLFNSHLFDFTEGWIYVLGVGAGIGTMDHAPKLRASNYFIQLIARDSSGRLAP